jgi:hypothetical protein
VHAWVPVAILKQDNAERLGLNGLRILIRALACREIEPGMRALSARALGRDLGMDPGNAARAFQRLVPDYFTPTGRKSRHWPIYVDGPALLAARGIAVESTAVQVPGNAVDSIPNRCRIDTEVLSPPTAQQQEPNKNPTSSALPRAALAPLAGTRRGAALVDDARAKEEGASGSDSTEHDVEALREQIVGAFARWSFPNIDEQTAKQRVRADIKVFGELAGLVSDYARLATWQAALASSSRASIRSPIRWLKTVLPKYLEAPEPRDYDAEQRTQRDERLEQARQAAEQAGSEDLDRLEPIRTKREAELLLPGAIVQHDDGKRAAVLGWVETIPALQVCDAIRKVENISEAELGCWHRTGGRPPGGSSATVVPPPTPAPSLGSTALRSSSAGRERLRGRGAEFMQEQRAKAAPAPSPASGTPEIADTEMTPAP